MQATLISPANRAWQAYCTQLVRRPLLSRCLTGVVGAIVSDSLAQLAANAVKRKQHPQQDTTYDLWRTARLCTYSFAVGTPIGANWFHFLDTTIMPLTPKAPQAIFLKILLDQLIMAPLGTAMFFCGIKTLEGDTAGIPAMFNDKYVDCMKANYLVWPLVHVVNFGLVPASQRILFVNAVSILWGMVMSHMVLGKEGLKAQPAEEVAPLLSRDGRELKADTTLVAAQEQARVRRRKAPAAGAAAEEQAGAWGEGASVGLAWVGPSGAHTSVSARAPGLPHRLQGALRSVLGWLGIQRE